MTEKAPVRRGFLIGEDMANTVIIDGNSIAHASHNSPKLTVGSFETQAIFGMLKTLRAMKRDYPGWNFIVLWDGRAEWRFDLLPEYKGNRVAKNDIEEKDKAAFKAQSPFIRKALSLLGVRQLLVATAEADDMAGILSQRLSASGNLVVLMSGDKDWIQLVNPRVKWFDPIRNREVTEANFFEFTGYRDPQAFIDGKALTGDSSDNISGVGGIGEMGAPEFVAEFGSVQSFFDLCDSGKHVPKLKARQRLLGTCPLNKDEWIAKFEHDVSSTVPKEKQFKKYVDSWPGQGRLLFPRNRRLMNLLDAPKPSNDDVTVIPAKHDKDRFRILCEKLAFASILREFDAFTKTFEGA